MKIALEMHPEIRELFGPDRRGALITVVVHIAQWLVLLYIVPAIDSLWWPAFLSATVITLFYGVHFSQLHEGMHNLCWPSEFGSRLLDVLVIGGTPFRGLAERMSMIRGHLRVHHARTFGPGDFDTELYLYEMDYDTSVRGAVELLRLPPLQRIKPQVVFTLTTVWCNLVELFLHAPLMIVKHVFTNDTIKLPNRLPVWFFVASWAYQVFCAIAPPIGAAYLWPDRPVSAAASVVLAGLLAEAWQYVPLLPFAASLTVGTLDHLLIDGDQPSFSIQHPLVQLLTLGFCCHAEHHDFARIPSWKLRHLAAIAPEFYTDLKDFGAMDRLYQWFAKRWSADELVQMSVTRTDMRDRKQKFNLHIDFSGYDQRQYDRAASIAASMNASR